MCIMYSSSWRISAACSFFYMRLEEEADRFLIAIFPSVLICCSRTYTEKENCALQHDLNQIGCSKISKQTQILLVHKSPLNQHCRSNIAWKSNKMKMLPKQSNWKPSKLHRPHMRHKVIPFIITIVYDFTGTQFLLVKVMNWKRY